MTHSDERPGTPRFDAADPKRLASEWLGLSDAALATAPGWLLEAIALRLSGWDPHAALRRELLDRLHQVVVRLHEQARTDQLTGMANRRALAERLADEMLRSKRYRRDLTIVVLDVDGLKLVNDAHGHAAGDDLLGEVGRRLSAAVRATDLPGRWGGDEFAVICPETDAMAAGLLGRKLREMICMQPMVIAGRELPISVSVGWGVDGSTGDAGSLLAAADASLYAAKNQRRGARS